MAELAGPRVTDFPNSWRLCDPIRAPDDFATIRKRINELRRDPIATKAA